MTSSIHPYAEAVRAGSVVVGELLRCAVERDLADLERWPATSQAEAQRRGDPYYFDLDAAEGAVAWPALYCRQVDGEFAGELLVLQPWQGWIEWVTEGWRDAATGHRRYRHRYIKVGSGNGKTTWAASHGTRMLLGDGEAGAEIYTVGTHRGQAQLLWNAARDMVRQSESLRKRLAVYDSPNRHEIEYEIGHAVMKPLSRDTEAVSQEGLKPHAVYFDEVHEYRGFSQRKLYDILLKKGLKRRQAIYTYITTAGDGSPEALITELDAYSEDVLRGRFEDPHWFAAVYMIDEEDDPFAPGLSEQGLLHMLRKANPNLGVSVHTEILLEQWRTARQVPAKRPAFLRYSCNRDASTTTLAINPQSWDACAAGRDDWDEHCLGEQSTLGVDLSSTIDLTSIAEQCTGRDGLRHFRWHNFMPAGQVVKREREDQVPYTQWAEEGWLTLVPGDRIDYQVVGERIMEILGRQVVEIPGGIGYDPARSTELCNYLDRQGVPATIIPQYMTRMAEATILFLDELETGEIRHDGSPLVAFCAKNAVTREDSSGLKKFDKRLARHRIDPLMAAVMARQRAMWLDLGGSTYDDDEPVESGTAIGADGEPGEEMPGVLTGGSMYDEIPAEYLR